MLTIVGLFGLLAMKLSHVQRAESFLLGLSLNVSVNGGIQELTESVRQERDMGCNLMASPYKWSDLELKPGTFNLSKLELDFKNQIQLGFTPVPTLQTIDTDKRTLPADLAGEPWDSKKMLDREQALIEAIARVLPAKVGVVILGNEVDGYLSSHPAEVKPYIAFLSAGRKTLQSIHPSVKVGVVTMYNGLSSHRDMVREVQANMDLVAMTYYPVSPSFKVFPVRDVRAHFDEMIAFAGRKLLYLQEIGYPASPAVKSSDGQQAAFVEAMFDELQRYRAKLYGACYFLLVDFNDKLLDSLMTYYSLDAAPFRAMLGTLGLKRQDGSARPAFSTFVKRARAFERGSR
jgi:hypothetical protein